MPRPPRHPARAAATAALLAAALCLPSCDIDRRGGSSTGRGPVTPINPGDSPFAPVRLVIHPLTRLVKDPATGEEKIEAHLELQDRWDDSVKWLGVVVFELFRESAPVVNGPGGNEQVKVWRIDLTNPDENAKPYDRVTRTYRLTLVGLPAQQGRAGKWKLSAKFNTPDGRTLSASYRFDD